MEIYLDVSGSDRESHLHALRSWLTGEDELRGRLTLRSHQIEAGQMGGILDVLVVALGSGGAGAVLAGSLSTWLTQRRVDLTVTVSTPDGRHVTVDVRRARDPQAVTREIQTLLSSLGSGPPP
jgi:hypothetical protein